MKRRWLQGYIDYQGIIQPANPACDFFKPDEGALVAAPIRTYAPDRSALGPALTAGVRRPKSGWARLPIVTEDEPGGLPHACSLLRQRLYSG